MLLRATRWGGRIFTGPCCIECHVKARVLWIHCLLMQNFEHSPSIRYGFGLGIFLKVKFSIQETLSIWCTEDTTRSRVFDGQLKRALNWAVRGRLEKSTLVNFYRNLQHGKAMQVHTWHFSYVYWIPYGRIKLPISFEEQFIPHLI